MNCGYVSENENFASIDNIVLSDAGELGRSLGLGVPVVPLGRAEEVARHPEPPQCGPRSHLQEQPGTPAFPLSWNRL